MNRKFLLSLKIKCTATILVNIIANKVFVALAEFGSSVKGFGWIKPWIWLISLNIVIVFSKKYINSFFEITKNKHHVSKIKIISRNVF